MSSASATSARSRSPPRALAPRCWSGSRRPISEPELAAGRSELSSADGNRLRAASDVASATQPRPSANHCRTEVAVRNAVLILTSLLFGCTRTAGSSSEIKDCADPGRRWRPGRRSLGIWSNCGTDGERHRFVACGPDHRHLCRCDRRRSSREQNAALGLHQCGARRARRSAAPANGPISPHLTRRQTCHSWSASFRRWAQTRSRGNRSAPRSRSKRSQTADCRSRRLERLRLVRSRYRLPLRPVATLEKLRVRPAAAETGTEDR
jgi:hypothetical protein